MGEKIMKEAMLYERKEGESVRCALCSHRCLIPEGKRGICGVRENRKGTLYSLVYGKAIAAHIDPVEKKPFFHFLPGTYSFSVATVGCNFRCAFCQNWEISQALRENADLDLEDLGSDLAPEEIVSQAKAGSCRSIAYTYTEPTIFFEYALDTGRLARDAGLRNLYVTNGYMTEETLNAAKGYMDAANVDLKSFSDAFYKETCGGRLEPVLESIKRMKKLGVWVEITTLLIPGKNDSKEELSEIAAFIANEAGKETPWHISRFHPDYLFDDVLPTDVESVEKAREIGLEAGLKYVYTGNAPGDYGEKTYCPKCKAVVIDRYAFNIRKNNIIDGRCPKCGEGIDGVWK